MTRAFFAAKGMDVDVIKIEGSVELAPILGLADAIVDIVETGATLKANGLVPIETVAPRISARLIVNTASMKLYKNEILDFISKCEQYIGGITHDCRSSGQTAQQSWRRLMAMRARAAEIGAEINSTAAAKSWRMCRRRGYGGRPASIPREAWTGAEP